MLLDLKILDTRVYYEKILGKVSGILYDIGTARAATIATRSGKIDLAKEIMTKKAVSKNA